MAFIGNTNTTQAFTPAIDYFSGDDSTVAFTLSRPVASVAQVQAVVNNVAQNPSSAFSVSGNTITFTSAPSAGTSNIYVYYTSPITQVIQPSQGTVGSTQLVAGAATQIFLDSASATGTGAMKFPVGTTAQRPDSPVVGNTRWNSSLAVLEIWNGVSWVAFSIGTYNANYLVVAGGGSGGGRNGGGGGGAGGYISNSAILSEGTIYTITVGAGGTASPANSGASGSVGSNSSISSIGATANGGGFGGNGVPAASNGGTGGSGGGGGGGDTTAGSGASGTSGQGNTGGNGAVSAGLANGGGGGGAGAVGNNGSVSAPFTGTGGAGLASSITGSSVNYAGGGGGGSGSAAGLVGGTGGGGTGGTDTTTTNLAPTAGTVNTGGGGGGVGGYSSPFASGAGGSGIVIISYLGSQRGTGGTVTTSGGYTIHTFTSSSTYNA
jgi:hypothetical protein